VLFAEASPAIDADGNKVIAAAACNLKVSGAKRVEVRGYTDLLSRPKVNTPRSTTDDGSEPGAGPTPVGGSVLVGAAEDEGLT